MLKKTIEKVLEKLSPDKTEELKGVIAFVIMGEAPEEFAVDFNGKIPVLIEGGAKEANCTFITDMATLKDIMEKRKDPVSAFMKGNLKFKGDMGIALKINSLLFK